MSSCAPSNTLNLKLKAMTNSAPRTGDDPYQLLKFDEAAKLLGVSRRTVERLIAGQFLPRPIKVGGCSRIRRSCVIDYIEGQVKEGANS